MQEFNSQNDSSKDFLRFCWGFEVSCTEQDLGQELRFPARRKGSSSCLRVDMAAEERGHILKEELPQVGNEGETLVSSHIDAWTIRLDQSARSERRERLKPDNMTVREATTAEEIFTKLSADMLNIMLVAM